MIIQSLTKISKLKISMAVRRLLENEQWSKANQTPDVPERPRSEKRRHPWDPTRAARRHENQNHGRYHCWEETKGDMASIIKVFEAKGAQQETQLKKAVEYLKNLVDLKRKWSQSSQWPNWIYPNTTKNWIGKNGRRILSLNLWSGSGPKRKSSPIWCITYLEEKQLLDFDNKNGGQTNNNSPKTNCKSCDVKLDKGEIQVRDKLRKGIEVPESKNEGDSRTQRTSGSWMK